MCSSRGSMQHDALHRWRSTKTFSPPCARAALMTWLFYWNFSVARALGSSELLQSRLNAKSMLEIWLLPFDVCVWTRARILVPCNVCFCVSAGLAFSYYFLLPHTHTLSHIHLCASAESKRHTRDITLHIQHSPATQFTGSNRAPYMYGTDPF